MNGEIEFEGALRERVALLAGLDARRHRPVIAERITLAAGGRELVATMNAAGAFTMLVSGGFTTFTTRIAAMLGFREHQANTCWKMESLTGKVAEPILGRAAKAEALRKSVAARLGLTPADAIAVGDGANDLDMIEPRRHRRRASCQALRRRRRAPPHRPRRPDRASLHAGLPPRRVRRHEPDRDRAADHPQLARSDRDLFHEINSDDRVMAFFPFRRDRAQSDEMMDRLRADIEPARLRLHRARTEGDRRDDRLRGPDADRSLPPSLGECVEIGWRLAPRFWGKGYATEAANACSPSASTNSPAEIVSFAVWNNHASTAVMRRIGMVADPAGDFDHPERSGHPPPSEAARALPACRKRLAQRKKAG
jgi:HAD superfamily phosphoserine phosphatase-like hydrolase